MKPSITQSWKIIVGLVAIFIGGLGFGAVLSSLLERAPRPSQPPAATTADHDWVANTLASLDQSLHLTPEQKTLILPQVEASAREIQLIREGALLKFQLSLLELHRSIRLKLDEDQRETLDKSQKILEDSIRHRSDALLDSDPQAK